ncbi:hypothetical protein B4U80_12854 [Leptotrombidium deliense]|uniref:EF-hand domain-containing protein n=1 Tax=Leptotrombidium deliense TaxID=299467 RepID=A0A443SJK5_9ACAR|nr:hypothetical protein B4U80_12854 [Leptotrombidium deliense]
MRSLFITVLIILSIINYSNCEIDESVNDEKVNNENADDESVNDDKFVAGDADRIFTHLDSDNDGKISIIDLKNAVWSCTDEIIDDEVTSLMENEDSEEITWTDFAAKYCNNIDEECEKIRRRWTLLDINETNALSIMQLKDLLFPEHSEDESIRNTHFSELFEIIDTNNDTQISLDEYLQNLKNFMKDTVVSKEWIDLQENTFKLLDTNKNNFLDIKESEIGLTKSDQYLNILQNMIDESDKNEDGLLSRKEFKENWELFLIYLPKSFWSKKESLWSW